MMLLTGGVTERAAMQLEMSTWLKQRGDIFFKWCLATEEVTNKFGENLDRERR